MLGVQVSLRVIFIKVRVRFMVMSGRVWIKVWFAFA